jgi:hypothetical protein
MSNEPIETFFDEKQLAPKLRVSVGTLRLWRTAGKGPSYHKISQLVRYSPSDVRDWLLRQKTGGELQRLGVAQ